MKPFLLLPLLITTFSQVAFAQAVYSKSNDLDTIEVKIDAVSSQIPQALQALGLTMAGAQQGQIYFYDTEGLDLYKNNILIRVREGQPDNDVTARIRPAQADQISPEWFEMKGFKCVYDAPVTGAVQTCSLKEKFSTLPSPLLSDDQKEFLTQYGNSNIPWAQIRRIGPIAAADWTLRNGVSVELWTLGQLRYLEFSAQVPLADADTARSSIMETFQSIGLSQDPNGENKTEEVMQYLLGHN